MKITLKRTLTAGILALGLVTGSIAAAAPASAATKYDTFNESITVGKHVDHLIYKPASKKEFKGFGADAGRVTAYDIKLKHGKKVLFSKHHVNTWLVSYVDIKVFGLGDKTYKSDKVIVKKLRASSHVSTAHAKRFVKAWLKSQGGSTPSSNRQSQTQACVNSVVTTVQVNLVEDVAVANGRTDCDNGIYAIVTFTDAAQSVSGYPEFTVVGYDGQDNYKYTYASFDGTFKSGTIN